MDVSAIVINIAHVGSCNCPECVHAIHFTLQQKFNDDPTNSYIYYGYNGKVYTYNGNFGN